MSRRGTTELLIGSLITELLLNDDRLGLIKRLSRIRLVDSTLPVAVIEAMFLARF
nr:hypothetical protein [Mycobacterium pseudoshottsii]